MKETIVIALGGNAILQAGEKAEYTVQQKNVDKTAKVIANLIKEGYRVVIAHGNGPQVGNLVLQNEIAKEEIPVFPLDLLTSQTQGFIGFMILNSLENELTKIGITKNITCLLTQVVVDENDNGFINKTKPIGKFYSKEEADFLQKTKGYEIIEDAGRGYRRVVASPMPKKILEINAIKNLLDNEFVVVAGGGGGIPIVETDTGYKGVEAVIDKDFCSSLMAKEIDADRFMILTDVENVYLDYKKDNEKKLKNVSVSEMEGYVAQGHFSKGSMEPKVLAAINFSKSTKRPSHICSLDKALESLEGKSGTIINL